jgi:hypothetical protein
VRARVHASHRLNHQLTDRLVLHVSVEQPGTVHHLHVKSKMKMKTSCLSGPERHVWS